MKKVSVLFFALIFISVSGIAKDSPILGNWLLTKVVIEGQTQEMYSEINFKADGYAEMQGRVFGTWVYNKKAKTVIIESEMIEEFSGEWNFTKLNKTDVQLTGDKTQLFFKKLDIEKIGLANKNSGFIGVWKMNLGEGQTYIKFEAPNTLSMITKTEYGSSNGGGTWIYDQSNNSIILVTNNRELTGGSIVTSINSTEFTIEKNGNAFKGVKIEGDSKGVEKLTFTSDDIIESMDNRSYEVSIESTNSSWLNPEAKTSYLKNITSLKYKYSSLLEGIDLFVGEEVSAKVEFDENYDQVSIEPIFEELSTESSDDNPFYPIEEFDTYRLTGEETITVPAGTFNCQVIEAIGDYGDRKEKYYMISNRPGVYAKIILVKGEDGNEQNSMYELMEINSNYESRTENDIIGNWLLVKTEKAGKSKPTSKTMEFIDDGRLSVNNTNRGTFSKWTASEENNTVSLNLNSEIQEFNITKHTSMKMVLQNDEQTYNLVKWDSNIRATHNSNSSIGGYWMLAEGENEFSVLDLTNNSTYSEMEDVRKMPIESNYKRLGGNWMHITADSTLVFSNNEQESSLTGSYKITKLTNDVMVLNKGIVYLKIDPETITKNNKESGIEGVWEISSSNGNELFYEFKAPYEFKRGDSQENMWPQGLWFYNPVSNSLFVGVGMHQLGGESRITEITQDSIKFENGTVATRVK